MSWAVTCTCMCAMRIIVTVCAFQKSARQPIHTCLWISHPPLIHNWLLRFLWIRIARHVWRHVNVTDVGNVDSTLNCTTADYVHGQTFDPNSFLLTRHYINNELGFTTFEIMFMRKLSLLSGAHNTSQVAIDTVRLEKNRQEKRVWRPLWLFL